MTYTFPMTPEQWDAADFSFYTLCRIMDTQGIAIFSMYKTYENIVGTVTVDRLGNFVSGNLKFARR